MDRVLGFIICQLCYAHFNILVFWLVYFSHGYMSYSVGQTLVVFLFVLFFLKCDSVRGSEMDNCTDCLGFQAKLVSSVLIRFLTAVASVFRFYL